MTGGEAAALYAWINTRPDRLSLRARLQNLGLDVAYFARDEVYVRVEDCQGDEACPQAFLVQPFSQQSSVPSHAYQRLKPGLLRPDRANHR